MHHVHGSVAKVAGLMVIALVGSGPACDGGSGDTLPLDQLETSYTHAYCERVVECNFGGLGTLVDNDVAGCVTLLGSADTFPLDLPEVMLSINAGYIQYDGARAQSCLDTLASATCEELATTGLAGTACADMLTGLLDQDADCTMDEECAGGWCDDRQQCPGQCTLTVLIGGTCANNARCEPGAYCNANEYCASSSERVPVGEPCGIYTPPCEYGLWCNPSGQECETIGEVGTYCESWAACLGGLFCGDDGRCAEILVVSNVGEACDEAAGSPCNPALGLACAQITIEDVTSGQCAPFAQENEHCSGEDPSTGVYSRTPCDPYSELYCERDDVTYVGTCQPKLPAGQACYEYDACLWGSCNSGVCETDQNSCH